MSVRPNVTDLLQALWCVLKNDLIRGQFIMEYTHGSTNFCSQCREI